MIEKIVNEINLDTFRSELINLLDYEASINTKKKNNVKLSKGEYIFDNYLIKPSFLLRLLIDKNK